jgi:hypothetical protein
MAWQAWMIGDWHRYCQAAAMGEFDRKAMLKRWTGADSSKAPGLTAAHFETCMAAAETRLQEEVDGGHPAPPWWRTHDELAAMIEAGEPVPKSMRHRHHYRDWVELAEFGSSRQSWLIRTGLLPALFKADPRAAGRGVGGAMAHRPYSPAWLLGVAAIACGCHFDSAAGLSTHHVSSLIEALKDHLRALGVDARDAGAQSGTRRRVRGNAD